MQKSIEERFWPKVDIRGKDECWNWLAAVKRKYGCIADGFNSSIFAHRASWEICNGPIPEGKFVLHKCDNKLCVNPNHLYIGTQRNNMEDRRKRNPDSYSKSAPMFDAEEVQDINDLYLTGKFTYGLLCYMFRCSESTIHKALKEGRYLRKQREVIN